MSVPHSPQQNTGGNSELILGRYGFGIYGFVYVNTVLYYVLNSTEIGWVLNLWKLKIEL